MAKPRYDADRGVYRDCKWCYGRGCLQCPIEAQKEYERQFPSGPQPIARFQRPLSDHDRKKLFELINHRDHGATAETTNEP